MAFFGKEQVQEAERRRRIYMEHPDELERLVVECNLFDTIAFDDPDFYGKMARRNYALSVLYDLGVLSDGTIRQIVDSLLKVNYISKEEMNG